MILSTDLLIIGSAGCGLTAAVRAKEIGIKRVTLVEKNRILGGSTRMSVGLWAVGSPLQRRMGINEDPDECFKEFMDCTNWEANPRLIRKYIFRSGSMIEWLEGKGVPFDDIVWKGGGRGVKGTYLGGRKVVHMAHARTGNYIITLLEQQARELGVDILTETRAEHLIQSESSEVRGAIVRRRQEKIRIEAKAVLLGTGTISNNQELIHQLLPQWDLGGMKIIGALPYATGDGYLMAKEVGARTGIVGVVFISPHSHSTDHHLGFLGRRAECVWLNQNGQRFYSESDFNYRDYEWRAGLCLHQQPGRQCWAVIDQALLDKWLTQRQMLSSVEYFQGGVRTGLTDAYGSEKGYDEVDAMAWMDQIPAKLEKAISSGICLKAKSLDEIAAWIGCNADALRRSMYNYNEIYCADGYDPDFLKDPQYLTPLRTPPYYVFHMEEGLDSINGGIQIDDNFRVLDEDWRPIPGLYAGGTCATGFSGRNYAFGGTCLGSAVFSGYVAPEIIAKEIRGEVVL